MKPSNLKMSINYAVITHKLKSNYLAQIYS